MALFLSFHDKLLKETSESNWNIQAILNLVNVDPSLLTTSINSRSLLMDLVDMNADLTNVDKNGLTLAALDALRYPDVYEDDLEKYRTFLKPSSNLISKLVIGGFEMELIMLLANTKDSIIVEEFPEVMNEHYEKIFNFETFSINSLSDNTIKAIRENLCNKGLGEYTHLVFEGYNVDFKEVSFKKTCPKIIPFYDKYGKGDLELDIVSNNSSRSSISGVEVDTESEEFIEIAPDDGDNYIYEHEMDIVKCEYNYRTTPYYFNRLSSKIVKCLDLVYNHESVSISGRFDNRSFYGAVVQYCCTRDKITPIPDCLIGKFASDNYHSINWLIIASLRNEKVRPFLGDLLKRTECTFDKTWASYIVGLYGDDVKFQLEQFGKNFINILPIPTILRSAVDPNFDMMGVDVGFLNTKNSVRSLDLFYHNQGFKPKSKNIIQLFDKILDYLYIGNYIGGYILSLDLSPNTDFFIRTVERLKIKEESVDNPENDDIKDFISGLLENMSPDKIKEKISNTLSSQSPSRSRSRSSSIAESRRSSIDSPLLNGSSESQCSLSAKKSPLKAGSLSRAESQCPSRNRSGSSSRAKS